MYTAMAILNLILIPSLPFPVDSVCSISIVDSVVTFPWRAFLWIPIDAPDGVWRVECVPSDDDDWAESKTDTGHECGMYMWFVDLYIGKGPVPHLRCCTFENFFLRDLSGEKVFESATSKM